MSIASRIITAREARGWDQKTLARILEGQKILTQQALSDLETGKSLSTRKLFELAGVLGVNSLWLQSGDGPMESDENGGDSFKLHQMSARIAPVFSRLDGLEKQGALPDSLLAAIEKMIEVVEDASRGDD